MEEKVRKLIDEEVKKLGVSIDSITYEKEGNNYFLRIINYLAKLKDIIQLMKKRNSCLLSMI